MITNAEKLSEWRKTNPDKRRAQKRAHYARHCEQINAKAAERRRTDPVFANKERARAKARYALKRAEVRAAENAKRAANRESYRARARQDRANNRATYLLYDVRKRCKKHDLECDLTVEWIESKFAAGVCDMSGITFDMEAKRGDHTPSVDRIDPAGPYTMANCRMIIWFLNRAMSNRGEVYILDLFRRVLEKRA